MKRIGFILAILAGVAAGAFAGDEYAVDPVHSHVEFSVVHMVISRVHGQFTAFSGTFLYDAKDVAKSSVMGKITVDSIHTANEKRDADLKSDAFFDAKKYPEIAFESKRIEKTRDGYSVTGILSMHGVDKEITFPFVINGVIKDPWGNERLGVEASLKLNRQDWGLNYSKTLDAGGLVVGNEIQLDLSAEFVKQKPKTPAPAK